MDGTNSVAPVREKTITKAGFAMKMIANGNFRTRFTVARSAVAKTFHTARSSPGGAFARRKSMSLLARPLDRRLIL